jgi:hypothetical protein
MPKLKTCKACSGAVSSQAYSCPHCGHPLRKPPTHRLAQGCGGLFAMIAGLIILFGLGFVVFLAH